MKEYTELVKLVLNEGVKKSNRTGIDTLSYPCANFRFDMSTGEFPLLTTKRMPLRLIAVELEGYLKGITSKKWYKNRGCNIWNNWANPKKVAKSAAIYDSIYDDSSPIPHIHPKPSIKEIAYNEDDLGTTYPYELRRFGQVYDEDCGGILEQCDQLKNVVETLKSNPTDRRMVALYFCPFQLEAAALPACVIGWCITVIGNKLHLSFWQRSCDIALGLPWDIANHALLLLLLAKEANLSPGILSAQFVDLHVYDNCIEGLKTQIERRPYPLPNVEITGNKSIFDWEYTDIELSNYQYWPKIKFGEVAV